MSRSVAVAALMIGQGLNAVASFLFLPYIARSLSVRDYGTYSQTMMVVDLFKLFFALGMSRIIFIYFADAQQRPNHVFQSNIAACMALGALCFIAVASLAWPLSNYYNNPELRALLPIVAMTAPFQFTTATVGASMVYFKAIRRSVQVSVFCNLLRLTLLAGAIHWFHSLEAAMIALVIAAIVEALTYWVFRPKELSGNRSFDWALARKQAIEGIPIMTTAFIGMAFTYTSWSMVSRMLSVEDFAIFRNGAVELPFIASLYGSIGAIMLPDIAKLYQARQFGEIVSLKKRGIRMTAALVIPIVVFILFFGKPLITLYLSEKYAASSAVFMIYNLSLLVRVNNYQDLFIASNKNSETTKIFLAAFAVNIGLNYVLTLWMGIIGAAIASVISLVFLAYLMLFYGTKHIHSTPAALIDFAPLAQIGAVSAVLCGALFGAYQWSGNEKITLIVFLFLNSALCLHYSLKIGAIDSNVFLSLINKFSRNPSIVQFLRKIYS